MSQQRAQRGFSLTELIVGIAVFALIFIAALLLYDRANKVFKSSMQSSDVQQNTRVAFERLMSELRMAGFDFDRDGYPQGTLKYQQPDEQLEFIHPHAITFRSNLDYESDAATDNGRETAYEYGYTTTSTADDYFPIVTTANDEIVTYFLRSANNSANDDTITFYADVSRPRKTFPVTGVGVNETAVTIPNVDLCQDSGGVDTGCMNPPYTLYRLTLKTDGTPEDAPVPVATNIRSIKFTYYNDTIATEEQAPNGGGGPVLVTGGATTAASIAARDLRGNIRSMNVELVGMSQSGDSGYVDPVEAALSTAEQVASAKSYHQYRLASTLVPRNLGKRGLQELDVKPPGQPDISAVCAVGCGVVKVKWNAPNRGTVTGYSVVYDTNSGGTFNSATTDAGRNLYAYVSGLTPGTTYYFKVLAQNAHGTNISNASSGMIVINRTQPEAPATVKASGGSAAGSPAAVNHDINVSWMAPQNNIVFNGVSPTNSCGEGETTIASQPENSGYIVKRSTVAAFDPDVVAATTTQLYSGAINVTGGPSVDGVGNAVFADTTQKLNCSPYYYAVKANETGCGTAALNSSGDPAQALSPWSAVVQGASTATVAPAAPVNPTVIAGSTCATNPCTISLQWPEVTTDADGKPIWVDTYVVRRRTYVSGVFQTGSEVTFAPMTDVFGNGTASYTDNTAPRPTIPGTTYYYAVAARQCTTQTSGYSIVEARYPCANLTISAGGSMVVDGTGSATDPWLIGADTAQINVTSNVDMTTATASVRQYPSGSSTSLGNGLSPTNPRLAGWSFPMPGSGNMYEFTINLTDTDGCTAAELRYVQEAPAACCLQPFKDTSGTTFDSTIIALPNPLPNSGNVDMTVNLKNMCDDTLTINSIKVLWNGFGTTGSANNVVSVKFPTSSGTVTSTLNDNDGSLTLTPSSVPGARTTIAGDSTYPLIITFTRAQDTSTATVDNVCVNYTRNSAPNEDCRIVQTAGTTCPP